MWPPNIGHCTNKIVDRGCILIRLLHDICESPDLLGRSVYFTYYSPLCIVSCALHVKYIKVITMVTCKTTWTMNVYILFDNLNCNSSFIAQGKC